MLRKVLIANRGEIASRISRTALDRSLPAVIATAAEDRALSERIGVPLAQLPNNYTDIEGIIKIAHEHGCDSIHPGYGFLSESDQFAQAVREHDLTFIGPQTDTLKIFGDKLRARDLAVDAQVSVAPGRVVRDATELEEFLKGFGGSGILKSRAGGGGRGIRAVKLGDNLEDSFARCLGESKAFGTSNSGLLIEQAITNAQHIEVQILADSHKNIIHLFDRECSLQRRHQKLVEVAPSSLPPPLKQKIFDDAIALAHASNYEGLGTFEFLVNDDGHFFMECNPRLQVEHTVTESITGIDLVECQFAVAEGATLQEIIDQPPTSKGFSVQTRILAEKMDITSKKISPSCEPLSQFEPPSGHGIRVETAMAPGAQTHPSYDSLIAKVIAHAPSLQAAIRKSSSALNSFAIAGPTTNLPLLKSLLDRPEVKSSTATTTFVDDHMDELSANLQSPSLSPTDNVDGAIVSPVTGTVVELNVQIGDKVTSGQQLAVLDSMKMEIVVPSTVTGEVKSISAKIGDVLNEGQVLVLVDGYIDEAQDCSADVYTAEELNDIRADLASLNKRKEKLYDENRPKAVERRRGRGQLTARECIGILSDDNDNDNDNSNFREYGGLAVAASRRTRKLADLEESTPADGIITGKTTIDGAECVVIAVDATVIAGTQGYFHHHKIDRAVEVATKNSLPIVVLPEGGGGRPVDTDIPDIMSAGLNLGTWTEYSKLAGTVPRLAVVSGRCFAGSAAIAGASDVVIATKDSTIGMGGPAMIEGGGLGIVTPEEVGPSHELSLAGAVDVVAEDDEAALILAKKYLSFFTDKTVKNVTSKNHTQLDQRILRKIIPENRKRSYDMRKLIDSLCDEDSVLEMRPLFGGAVITALARIEGKSCGIVASNPASNGGAIDANACDKVSRFFRLLHAFDIPVVSLVDCPGFMVGPAAEKTGLMRKAGRLFLAGAVLEDSIFAVITRKAVGLGAMALCGGNTKQPVETVAWPTGEIGAMGVEGAVNLGFKKELEALEGDDREKLFEKLVAAVYKQQNATNAASKLEIDDVIDPADTRARLALNLTAYYKNAGKAKEKKATILDSCW